MSEIYDEDYFERGIETGKSCYQNYRWIPDLTIPMAMSIIDFLKIESYHTILDFGCAKGYLVKAFRWLRREAWGVDISKYAIANCDSEISQYCGHLFLNSPYDFIVAKDVFEHMTLEEITEFVRTIEFREALFAVIPLGENGEFRAPANNTDITHVSCYDQAEWTLFFKSLGLKVDFTFRIKGIKDSYYEKYPTAHGFFTLRWL